MRFTRCSIAAVFLSLGLSTGAASAQELFKEEPGAFGMQPCGPNQNDQGCWTNYMLLADMNNDGDLDVLFPNARGFFTKAAAEPFVMYENGGASNYTEVSANLGGGYTGWLRQVAVADVNGDGFTDIYAPAAWGDPDKFFINDGTGTFTDESASRLPGVASNAGAARFGDVDNDGDMDLLVGDNWTGLNGGTIAHLYLNDGTGKLAEAGWELPVMALGDQPIDLDLLDLDGDFDLDLYIDMHSGTSASVWKNDGTGHFTDATADVGIPNQKSGSFFRYGPVACDVDGDGDLDIWQDNAATIGGKNGLEMLLINDGTGHFADETAARVTGNPSADDNGLACVDVDGDGDLDVAIMSLTTAERVLLNDGTGHFNILAGAFTNIQDPTLWFDFGDLNGDGRLDVVTAQGEGTAKLNRVYLGTDKVPVDAVAPKIRGVEDIAPPNASEEPAVRFAVSDSATTDTGPRLKKAYVKVTAPTTAEAPAMFVGGDLFRAVLPSAPDGAIVTFQACAVDLQDNEGCSDPKMYAVKGTGGTGGSGGTGTGGSTGGTGTVTGGSGGGGAGGGGAGGSASQTGDTGCGCTIPGGERGTGTLAVVLGSLLLAAWNRRRGGRS